jgi:hypothetical protein
MQERGKNNVGSKLKNHDVKLLQNPKHKNCCFVRMFPFKLLDILDDAEVKGIADIISWKLRGRAFATHCTKDFAERVMPLWFNQSSIRSFSFFPSTVSLWL